jgi:multisubunit Na+/H+ antiporter MnhF subunit
MQKKHWTPQRIIILTLLLIFVIYKFVTEDDISRWLAIIIFIVAMIGTLIYYKVRKKGIFAK